MSRLFTMVAALSLATASLGSRAACQDSAATTATPPAPGPVRPYNFPTATRFTLDNGVNVIVLERHALPVVSASILVDAGALRESAVTSGVASLTGSLLSSGTRELGGAQLAEWMERYGADFSTGADHLQAGANVTALAPVFDAAFALAATAITEPSFPEREVHRLQREALAKIAQRRASVEGLAAEVFARTIFDSASGYSRPAEGVPATVVRLTRADVVRWYRSAYGPRATTVLLVGDITPAAARQVVEHAFGDWVALGARSSTFETALESGAARPLESAVTTRVILIDRPGSVQSGVAIGQLAIAAADSNYLPMFVLNRVFGGAMSARLSVNLRERHGFTYGAYSRLDARRGSGSMVISAAVRTDATDSALVEALGEWRRIVRDTIPGPEFQRALNALVAGFPSLVQTAQGLRDRVATAITAGLPADFYASYRERLAAVSPANSHAAAARVLRLEPPIVVVVGDLRAVESRVRALNIGSVEVWDTQGKRVR